MSPRQSRKIGYTGVFLFTFGVLVQFLIAPIVLKDQMKKKIALKRGWSMRDVWSKLPFTTETHMYVFNVTNPLEIGLGAKPIVREIGPFVYDVYQEKTHQIDHEEDDTVSYVLKNVYRFNATKSHGLSDEVEVYFPHTYIMTMSNGVMKIQPTLTSFSSRSVDSILGKPESLFFKVPVKTALFDGFPIPCAGVDEYFGKLICNVLKERWFDYTVRKQGDTYYTSMFGFINGTYDKEKRVRINRGVKSLENVGKIVELDGKSSIATWDSDECDSFAGTDGTIFPPFMNEKTREDVHLVYPLICRRLRFTYDSEVEFSGLKLLRYTGDVGTDGDNVPEEKCYCITPERCLKKGMFELFRCINVPIIASNPHFYLADPYYLTRVDTLTPDKAKHQLYVDFDPLTGTPLRAHVRIQFNMELLPIEQFRYTRNYSRAMLPLVWIDQILVLPDFLIDDIKFGHRMSAIAQVMEYGMMICGLAMCALAGYRNYNQSARVTELELKPSDSETNGTESNKSEDETKTARKIIGDMRQAAVPPNVA